MRVQRAFLLLGGVALLVPPALPAQIAPPSCRAPGAILRVARDRPTGEVRLSWNDNGCQMRAERSPSPLFPGGQTATLFDPWTGPSPEAIADPAPPAGNLFYRLAELDGGWTFWEPCWRSPGPSTRTVEIAYDDGAGIGYGTGWTPGDIEAVHFVPPAPMVLRTIRLRFAGAPGPAEVHVWADLGRSWPDTQRDLVSPVFLPTVDTSGWTTLDVSSANLKVHPRDHFWVGYLHQADQPYLALDAGSSPSHSLFKDPDKVGTTYVWGGWRDGNNYLLRVEADLFCELDRPFLADRSADFGLDQRHESRVAWGDVDGDRDDDLLLDGRKLLRNDGGAALTDVTATAGTDLYAGNPAGLGGGFGVFGDVDNDGDQDLYLAVYTPNDYDGDGSPAPPQAGDPRDAILLNDGTGVFTPVGPPSGVEEFSTTAGAAFGDFDADGWLDLYSGNWLIEYPNLPSMKDHLFRGVGDGTFTDVTDASGMSVQGGPQNLPCYGVAPADYDNDGDLDIFVASYGRQPNLLWQNQHAQGSETFTDRAAQAGVDQDDITPGGGNTFGEDWGDIDSDGDLDLFLAEIAHPRYLPTTDISSLQVNSGAPAFTFQDQRQARGIHYDEGGVEASFADYDNDGDLDLLVSYLYPLHYARLYRQEADGRFTDVSYEAGLLVHDATNHAWADFDRDGDLDLAITSRGGGSHVWLFENLEGTGNHWLAVRLEGLGCTTIGECNCGGVGARVTVTAGGRTQMREAQGGKGHFNSQPSLPVEFGLGPETAIDELRVRWPCGRVETYTGALADRFLLVREGEAAVVPE